MIHKDELLERIKKLVLSGKYRVRIHAVRHMIEEGFTETNVIEAIEGTGRIIESYPDDSRCLIFGRFNFIDTTITAPLHVVCDYSQADLVDIVTAYIPQKPWWLNPTKRGKIS